MGARSSQNRGPGLNKTDGHLLDYLRNNFGVGGGALNTIPSTGIEASGGVVGDYTTTLVPFIEHMFLLHQEPLL